MKKSKVSQFVNEQKAQASLSPLFTPIEIGLKINPDIPDKLQFVKRQKNQEIPIGSKIETTDIDDQSNQNTQGLISLLKNEQCKPEILICITVYNETQAELNTSLNGLLKNLDHFKRAGIQNHQIGVVVVFDGIDRMNNDPNSNENNMVKAFKEIDRKFNIRKENSLKHDYDEFNRNLKHSKINISKLRETKNLDIFLTDGYIKQKFEELNEVEGIDKNDPYFKFQFLEQQIIKKAQDYLNYRKDTALLYQTRKAIEIVQIEGDISQKQQQDIKQFIQDPSDRQSINKLLQIDENSEITPGLEDNEDYLYIFYCVKHKNGGKLSSHCWFFQGFCELLQPKYTILMDCGLEPSPTAIYNLYLALEADQNIGGVCGFMGIRLENVYDESGQRKDGYDESNIDIVTRNLNKVFDIQKCQMFEYNFAHIIDKPFESLFGFINVLPGAFSGYRWDALKADENGKSILDLYLKTVLNEKHEFESINEANMYLAEDRILCLKIFTKYQKKYRLKYIPTSKVVVDPVTNLINLIGQRKRWINGTYFALEHVLQNRDLVFESSHTLWEQILFKMIIYFSWINQIITYNIIGIFICSSSIIFSYLFGFLNLKVFNQNGQDSFFSFNTWFYYIYVLLTFTLLFYSLQFNIREKKVSYVFYLVSSFLGIIMLFAFIMAIIFAVQLMFGGIQNDNENAVIDPKIVQVGIAITFGLYIFPVFFNLDKATQLLTSLPHYLFFTPTYINTLIIYAFGRIDDLSWGTKGLEGQNNSSKLAFNWIKYEWVIKWVSTNVLISVIFQILLDLSPYTEKAMVYVLLIFSTFQVLYRVTGSMIYYIYFYGYFQWKMRRVQKRNYLINKRNAKESKDKLTKFFYDYQLYQSKINSEFQQ